MAIRRVEIAVECDHPETEGVAALEVVVESLGLNLERDVAATTTVSEEDFPVLLALIQVGVGTEWRDE